MATRLDLSSFGFFFGPAFFLGFFGFFLAAEAWFVFGLAGAFEGAESPHPLEETARIRRARSPECQ